MMAAGLALGWIANTNAAPNLVVNGDFENGYTGFTSDYTQVAPVANSLFPESTYIVGTDPRLYHDLFTSYSDHTFGTPNGHMLIANGASDTTKNVWKTSAPIAVTPNTDYFFEAFMSSAYPTSPAVLSFELDGNVSDATLGNGVAPVTTGQWVGVSKTWNSGANTSVTLFLRNANAEPSGNDFAVDDINFSETSIVNTPDSASTLGCLALGLAGCVVAGRRIRTSAV